MNLGGGLLHGVNDVHPVSESHKHMFAPGERILRNVAFRGRVPIQVAAKKSMISVSDRYKQLGGSTQTESFRVVEVASVPVPIFKLL